MGVPPLVGVAVKVTLVPAQMVDALALILTLAAPVGFIVSNAEFVLSVQPVDVNVIIQLK